MSELIMKLIKGQEVTEKDIIYELYEICERVHSSCNPECPVYEVGGGIPYAEDSTNCRCFKDGEKMRLQILQDK
jgi:hypothetical protein